MFLPLASNVLLDSGWENAYAREVCQQPVGQLPLLLCDDLGHRASCPASWARKTLHATMLSAGEQVPCPVRLCFATTRWYFYARASLVACPRLGTALYAPPRLDCASTCGPDIAWFRPKLLRLCAGSALRASLGWNIGAEGSKAFQRPGSHGATLVPTWYRLGHV